MVKSNNQPICEINSIGTKYWYLNDRLHREDGPAVEYVDGDKWWYFHGKPHRLDGPTVEYTNGYKSWWYYGEQVDCSSQEEFERLIKLKALW